MFFPYEATILAIALCLSTFLLQKAGVRLGRRQIKNDPDGHYTGTTAVDGATFAILGLLVAFTFSGASQRFDERRSQVVQEANIIGTAYLRVDLLAPDVQPTLRTLMREYVDARIATYEAMPDLAAVASQIQRSAALQKQIWASAVMAVQTPGQSTVAAMLFLPALNEMFDIATTRSMAAKLHPPKLVYVMLICLCLVGGVLSGYGMASSHQISLLHKLALPVILAVIVNFVVVLEYPRFGLVSFEDFDKAIVDVRAGM